MSLLDSVYSTAPKKIWSTSSFHRKHKSYFLYWIRASVISDFGLEKHIRYAGQPFLNSVYSGVDLRMDILRLEIFI